MNNVSIEMTGRNINVYSQAISNQKCLINMCSRLQQLDIMFALVKDGIGLSKVWNAYSSVTKDFWACVYFSLLSWNCFSKITLSIGSPIMELQNWAFCSKIFVT